MWQMEDVWQDLKPGDKWWMGVSVALGVTGGLICIVSLTVLIGSGHIFNIAQSDKSMLVDAQGTIDDSPGSLDESANTVIDQSNSGMVVVDVSGGVNSPGLYQVSSGSRVGEVIEQAGGLATAAATQKIAQEVNLAAVVQDGQKIFIPVQTGSTAEAMDDVTSSPDQLSSATSPATNLVSINSASKSELDALPGIGEKRADAIITGRPYLSIEELVSEGAVTAGVLDDIKSLISL